MLCYFVICDVYYIEDAEIIIKKTHLLEVVSRCRDPRLQVGEKYLYNNNEYYSFNLRPHICKASCSAPDYNDLIDY